MTRDALADDLARAVTEQYASLPANGKPRPRTNGSPTWTVLAGFCLYRTRDEHVEAQCISIGTGLKALPHSKLPLHGDVLHDSHAEVIARRGLKLWLYDELAAAIRCARTAFLKRRDNGTWRLRDEWELGLWISTLPCGDASTYSLSLAAPASAPSQSLHPQNLDSHSNMHRSLTEGAALGMVTTRDGPTMTSSDSNLNTPLVHRGRVSYSSFSTLRTKPGRADSPPTTSHSCSDKIAMWSLLGIQGGLLATLGVHVELSFIGISGVKGDETEKEKIRDEVTRAVGGRLDGWEGPREKRVRVPAVGLADRVDFSHSRESVAAAYDVAEEEVVSCQESLSWIRSIGTEVITNGVRQGASPKRKTGEPLGPKARSRLSKLSQFQRRLEVERLELQNQASDRLSYYDAKRPSNSSHTSSDEYQSLKAAVREGPFRGWLVSGEEWESFNGQGHVSSS
ncbi:hypothetical protein JCM16303_001250 [Sporobolomyces ruberrimus]